MLRRVLAGMLWALAVVAGVAIAALSQTLCSPGRPGALPLLPPPALWAGLLLLAAGAAVLFWWRRRPAP